MPDPKRKEVNNKISESTNVYRKKVNRLELKNILKDHEEFVRTSNISKPRAEANKIEKSLPTKGTVDFFNKIKKELSPEAFTAALKIQNQRGNPTVNIGTNKGLPFHNRRNYNPLTNEINIPKGLPDSYDNINDYISEVSHAGQKLSEVIPRFIKNDIPAYLKEAYEYKKHDLMNPGLHNKTIGQMSDEDFKAYREYDYIKSPYTTKGTIENYTHEVIEPKIKKQFDSHHNSQMTKNDEETYYKSIGDNLNNKKNNSNNNIMNIKYAQGGNLTRFNEGGTHEQNPLGGVPQGQDAQGNMNTVEQGETKSGNFVYSDRITLDPNRIKQFNLPTYAANKSVSAASKAIEDKFKDRNDKYASETKKTLLDRLANAQESVKAEQAQTQQAMQTNSQQAPEDMMGGEIPEGMEEFVQPQESQTMAAYGGMQNKYLKGGEIDPATGLRVPMQALDPMQTAGMVRMPNAMPTAAAVPDSAGMQAASSTGTGAAPSAGAIVGGLSTAMELGQTAFGKASQDITGTQASDRVSGVGMIGGSAIKGAAAGAQIGGPWGAAIGGAVGGLAGLAGLGKARKAESLNTQRFATNTNRGLSDNYAAYGGNLNVYKYADGGLIDPPIKTAITQPQLAGNVQSLTGIGNAPSNQNLSFNTKQIVRYQPGVTNDRMGSGFYLYSKNVNEPGFDVNRDREFVKQSEMGAIQRTPEWATYMKGQTALKASQPISTQTRFDEGGDLIAGKINPKTGKRMSIGSVGIVTPSSDLINTRLARTSLPFDVNNKNVVTPLSSLDSNSNLNIQTPYNGNPYTDKAKLIGKDVSNYISENAGEALRYAPIAANLLQMKNLKKPSGVQYQTLGNRFKPSYADEAQGRNIVDAEGNNTIAAISQSGASQGATRNAILGAGLNKTKALSDVYANASAQNRAQDVQAQQFNLNVDQSNVATANKAIDEMRMDDAAYRGAKSKIIANLGNSAGAIGKETADSKLASALTGYTRKGNYLYKPDGSKVTPEEMTKLKNTTQSPSTPPTLKKGDKYTDENGKVQTFKYGGYLNTKRNK